MIFDRHSAVATLAAAALALAMAGCGEAERAGEPRAPAAGGPAVVLDLVAELPAADVVEEVAVIDLGRPEARPHLVSGWGADEEDAEGTYAWGLGEGASVAFYVATPTDVGLGLRCKPLAYEGAPEATLGLALNGEPLAELVLGRELERYDVEVPEAALAVGQNLLDFRFGDHRRPRDVLPGAADERSLAVRCYEIELAGLGAGASPRLAEADGAADRLELPIGTVVTYYFDLESSAELEIPALETWGTPAPRLRLVVRSRSAEAAEDARQVVDPGGVRGPLRLPLATAGPAVDRLELAAFAERRRGWGVWWRRRLGLDPRPGGVTLVRPAVRRLQPAAEEPPGPLSGLAAAPSRPHVILYLIDTLRADHLGVYGYGRPTSPNIDRFAADAVVFDNAQAQSSWTRPSVVSLLTGLQPRRHHVNRRRDALADSFETLAELLGRQGYATAAFVTNGNAGPDFALDQGFDEFRYLRESGRTAERHQLSDSLNQWVFHWLEVREDAARPFFLYAHATDPHAPYVPREPYRRRFAAGVDPEIGLLDNFRDVLSGRRAPGATTRQDLIDLYDAEIAFNDHHFGRLIERLKELGIYESSLVVLLSDHGEEFLDHDGWEHGMSLYGEQLHVPLIVKLPGGRGAGSRVAAPVGQVDVLPTVLDVLGLPVPPALDGRSLLEVSDASPRPSFAYLALREREIQSVVRRGWKLIRDDSPYPRGDRVQLYRLADDRGERVQLASRRPFERGLLAQLLRRFELGLEGGARGGQVEIPEELRRQLEALGYV